MSLSSLGADYEQCVATLSRHQIVRPLPGGGRLGVLAGDGRGYPLPKRTQVAALCSAHQALIALKAAQGLDQLLLTPLAAPLGLLLARVQAALAARVAAGVYATRREPDEPPTPLRVNAERQVWPWAAVERAIAADEVVYAPQALGRAHGGLDRAAACVGGRLCALPGWSIGLIERGALVPAAGQGAVVGGRPQLAVGASPREYLQALQTPPYAGETGLCIADALVRFLVRLDATGEVTYDRADDSAAWLLGQFLPRMTPAPAGLVPTLWWHRAYGRLRLDAHRPGNRACTRSWGCPTVARLPAAD